jgi:thiol-disulfide isomerase/thioredoxin
MRRLFAAVALSVAVATACSSGGSGSHPDLDAIKLTTFDGQATTLAAYSGKPLVVNFFASWCAPCKSELPGIESVHQALGPKVAFLGIDTNDTVADGQAMADDAKLTYEIVRDPKGSAVTALKGLGMPTTVLIDSSGKVVATHLGALKAADLRALIDDKLLA